MKGSTPEAKLAEVRRLNNDLRAGPGDAKAGKPIFAKHCATCHKLHGEGVTIGPDLTHANRRDRDFLLVSLVDPSNVIRAEFVSYAAEMLDGRVVTGIVVAQTDAELTFANAKGEKTTVRQADISALRASPTSLMPDDLY